jgi:hypothetical protein
MNKSSISRNIASGMEMSPHCPRSLFTQIASLQPLLAFSEYAALFQLLEMSVFSKGGVNKSWTGLEKPF